MSKKRQGIGRSRQNRHFNFFYLRDLFEKLAFSVVVIPTETGMLRYFDRDALYRCSGFCKSETNFTCEFSPK
jgi:hypothetical protein